MRFKEKDFLDGSDTLTLGQITDIKGNLNSKIVSIIDSSDIIDSKFLKAIDRKKDLLKQFKSSCKVNSLNQYINYINDNDIADLVTLEALSGTLDVTCYRYDNILIKRDLIKGTYVVMLSTIESYNANDFKRDNNNFIFISKPLSLKKSKFSFDTLKDVNGNFLADNKKEYKKFAELETLFTGVNKLEKIEEVKEKIEEATTLFKYNSEIVYEMFGCDLTVIKEEVKIKEKDLENMINEIKEEVKKEEEPKKVIKKKK